MAVTAPSFTTYDAKMDEVELKRAEVAATLQTTPVPLKEPLPPPAKTLYLEYRAPTGEEYEAEVVIRILSHDELIRVGQVAAQLAGTVNINVLPHAVQDLCMAHATFQVMWGRRLPTWLKLIVMTDDNAILQVYQAAVEHRQAYFRGELGAGGGSTRPAGLAIYAEKPPKTTPE